jgi:hypothetical protein
LALISILILAGRFPRGGDLLSFVSPKESKQRKDDPATRVPALGFGQPAVLNHRVGRRTRSALAALRSNSCGQSDDKADASCGASARVAIRHKNHHHLSSCKP